MLCTKIVRNHAEFVDKWQIKTEFFLRIFYNKNSTMEFRIWIQHLQWIVLFCSRASSHAFQTHKPDGSGDGNNKNKTKILNKLARDSFFFFFTLLNFKSTLSNISTTLTILHLIPISSGWFFFYLDALFNIFWHFLLGWFECFTFFEFFRKYQRSQRLKIQQAQKIIIYQKLLNGMIKLLCKLWIFQVKINQEPRFTQMNASFYEP